MGDGKKYYVGHAFSGKSANLPTNDEDENKQIGFYKWGKNNDYPNYLNRLYEDSAIHGGIINHKIDYLISGGYELQGNQQLLANALIENSITGMSHAEIREEVAVDYYIYGGFALRCVWNNRGDGLHFYEPIQLDSLRISSATPNLFMYSNDWTATTQNEDTGFRHIKGYDPENKRGEFILYFSKPSKKRDKKDKGIYPKPPYSGGIKAINTDTNIDTYHLNEIVNGFKTGTIISLNNGAPATEYEANKVIDEIKEGATGEDGAGGVLVLFSDGKERAATVENLNGNDLDKRYNILEQSCHQKIMSAHSVTTPALFGLKTSGQLGNVQELENGFQIYIKTSLKADQKFIDASFNYLIQTVCEYVAEIISLAPKSLFAPEEVDETSSQTLESLNSLSALVANKVLEEMTQNEIRALIGLEPTEGGDIIDKAFSSEDAVLKMLSSCGISKESLDLKEGRELPFKFSEQHLRDSEVLMLKKVKFNDELTPNESTILDALISGQDIDEIEIEGVTSEDIKEAVQGLKDKNLITNKENPTEKAEEAQVEAEFEILYDYVLRSDAPQLKPGGESRGFCKQLISLNRLYTRQEIESISASVGRNVWTHRGGWYHNPNTDTNEPSCRHAWKQTVVRK